MKIIIEFNEQTTNENWGGFSVTTRGKIASGLGWDEMLGLVASITLDETRQKRYDNWLKPIEDHKAEMIAHEDELNAEQEQKKQAKEMEERSNIEPENEIDQMLDQITESKHPDLTKTFYEMFMKKFTVDQIDSIVKKCLECIEGDLIDPESLKIAPTEKIYSSIICHMCVEHNINISYPLAISLISRVCDFVIDDKRKIDEIESVHTKVFNILSDRLKMNFTNGEIDDIIQAVLRSIHFNREVGYYPYMRLFNNENFPLYLCEFFHNEHSIKINPENASSLIKLIMDVLQEDHEKHQSNGK